MKQDPHRSLKVLAALLAGTLSHTTALKAHPMIPGITGYPALMLHPLLLIHQALALAAAALQLGRRKRESVSASGQGAKGMDAWGALNCSFGNLWKATAELNESLYPHVQWTRDYRVPDLVAVTIGPRKYGR